MLEICSGISKRQFGLKCGSQLAGASDITWDGNLESGTLFWTQTRPSHLSKVDFKSHTPPFVCGSFFPHPISGLSPHFFLVPIASYYFFWLDAIAPDLGMRWSLLWMKGKSCWELLRSEPASTDSNNNNKNNNNNNNRGNKKDNNNNSSTLVKERRCWK